MNIKNRYLVVIVLVAVLFGATLTYTAMEVLDNKEAQVSENNDSASNDDFGDLQASIEDTFPKDSVPELSKLMKAISIIQNNYVEDVDNATLMEGAIKGMLQELGDPHTVYMDVETADQFNDSLESSFEGIGAEVTMENGFVTIVAPIKGSPAEKAGLMPKDQIIKVDGESVEGLDLLEAVSKIRGEKGTTAKLHIQRPGVSKLIEVEVVRDEIPVETVYQDVQTIDGKKTGIIEITSFAIDTAKDFNNALKDLEEQGIEGLVIDVRGNPGGLFTSVEEILKNFIPEDQPYVIFEMKDGEKQRFFSGTDEKKDYPISVLINQGSASASEILAAAMKEAGYDVIGEQSCGKGTVQKTISLGDGSNIKVTIYKWLTPSGEWINEVGVTPTIETKQPDYFYTTPFEVEKGKPYKLDMASDEIANIQKMLNGIGFETGREDGYFDKKTEEAVSAFQAEYDLPVTGEIDTATGEKIQAAVIEDVRNPEKDLQLKKAMEELYK